MSDKEQMKVVFDEQTQVISQLDAIAEAEGTSRAALIRRAIRQLIFSSSNIPTFGNSLKVETPAKS